MVQTMKDVPEDALLECSFLMPIRSDGNQSNDAEREAKAWQWLESELLSSFRGIRMYRDTTLGLQRDPDSGQIVAGKLYRYTVPVEKRRLGDMRKLLISACDVFHQKSIYLSIAGQVEFVELPR